MHATANVLAPGRMSLWAETAADLMTTNPISIGADVTVREAVMVLIDRGFSAAPVIDEAGRPVGVVSRADILVHDREMEGRPLCYYNKEDLKTHDGEQLTGFQGKEVDRTRVSEIMTPAVFSVEPDTPAAKVVEQLLSLRVHRMFVVDRSGILLGVISALDVLRHLRPE